MTKFKRLDHTQFINVSHKLIPMVDFKLSLEKANRVLQELGYMNGIDIELDEEGAGFVEVEKTYPVSLQLTNTGNFLKLTAYVGQHRSTANPKTLEYLLSCNYEADFVKSCTIGLCSLTKRYTLSFMHPILNSDALLLNNSILNLGTVLKVLDKQLEQQTHEDQRAKHNPGKPGSAGLGNTFMRR